MGISRWKGRVSLALLLAAMTSAPVLANDPGRVHHRDDAASDARGVAKGAEISPEDQAAIAAARAWFEAVMAGDTNRVVEETALPFVLVVKGLDRDSFHGKPGVVSTRARLLQVLGALTAYCHAVSCCDTGPPYVDVQVRTLRARARVVSFVPNGYGLAEGPFYIVSIHVGVSTGRVIRAVFEGFHTS